MTRVWNEDPSPLPISFVSQTPFARLSAPSVVPPSNRRCAFVVPPLGGHAHCSPVRSFAFQSALTVRSSAFRRPCALKSRSQLRLPTGPGRSKPPPFTVLPERDAARLWFHSWLPVTPPTSLRVRSLSRFGSRNPSTQPRPSKTENPRPKTQNRRPKT